MLTEDLFMESEKVFNIVQVSPKVFSIVKISFGKNYLRKIFNLNPNFLN